MKMAYEDAALSEAREKLERLLGEEGPKSKTDVKEVLLLLVKENRELSKKVETLMESLQEAAKEMGNEDSTKTLHSISDSEVTILNKLESVAEEVKSLKERVSNATDPKSYLEISTHLREAKFSLDEVNRRIGGLSSKVNELDEILSELKDFKSIASENRDQLKSIERKTDELEQETREARKPFYDLTALKAEIQRGMEDVKSEQVRAAQEFQRRVEELRKEIESTHASVEEHSEKEGKEASEQLSDLKLQVSRVEEKLYNLLNDVQKSTASNSKLEDGLGKATYKLDLVQENLKEFEIKVSKEINLEKDDLHESLDALSEQLKENKGANIEPLREELSILSARVKDLNGRIRSEYYAELRGKLSSLTVQLSELKNAPDAELPKKVNEISEKADRLNSELLALKSRKEPVPEELKSEIALLRTQIEEAVTSPKPQASSKELESMARKLGALEAHMTAIESNIVGEFGRNISDLTARTEELQAKISTGVESRELGEVKSSMKTLARELGDLKARIPDNNTLRQAFSEDVKGLESQMKEMTEAIKSPAKQMDKESEIDTQRIAALMARFIKVSDIKLETMEKICHELKIPLEYGLESSPLLERELGADYKISGEGAKAYVKKVIG